MLVMNVLSVTFLCGLFHDLPEVLTRDIISPVKRSVPGLDELIKKIEERLVTEKNSSAFTLYLA